MPKFVVEFDRPIWYQPDHPVAARETQALLVSAPSPNKAQLHAIRVTRGDAEIKQIHPFETAPADLLAIALTPTTLPMTVDPATGLRTARIQGEADVAPAEMLRGA